MSNQTEQGRQLGKDLVINTQVFILPLSYLFMTEELDSVVVEKAYEELDDNILDIANDTLDYSVSQLKGL